MELKKYREELKELRELRKKVQRSLRDAPEGRLRSELAQGKYPQFYLVCEAEKGRYPRGRYLKKKDIAITKAYIQKEYDFLMLEEIDRREKEIIAILNFNEESEIRRVFRKLSPAKQLFVEPYVFDDEEYIREWEHSGNTVSNPYPIVNGFVTEKGEIVRSKSEKIIADKLLGMHIPYKYEAGLEIQGKKMIFPDFTILNIRSRREHYLEHFGMMDDPEYCKNALEKIDMYAKNGIFFGDKLLATFESSRKPLDIENLELILSHFVAREQN